MDSSSSEESSNSISSSENENEVEVSIDTAPSVKDFHRKVNPITKAQKIVNTYDNTFHSAISICAKIIGPSDLNIKFPLFKYVGDNAAREFIDYSTYIADVIWQKWILPDKELTMSVEEKKYHEKCWECHICKEHIHNISPVYLNEDETEIVDLWVCSLCDEQFMEKPSREEEKVPDHSHVSGYYRAPSHFRCNRAFQLRKQSWKLPIFFHNAQKYDSHFILTALNENDTNVRILPHNIENFISFTYGRCEVKDTIQFLQSGLEKLAKTLPVNDPYINNILEEA